MKQRNPLTATLLSVFIPFYMLYWLVVTANIMKERGAKAPNAWLLFAPLLSIPLFIAFALLGSSLGNDSGAPLAGALVFLLLIPAILISQVVYFYQFGKATEQATNKKVSSTVFFVLALLVTPAAVYISQDGLNEVINNPTTSPSPAPVETNTPPAPSE